MNCWSCIIALIHVWYNEREDIEVMAHGRWKMTSWMMFWLRRTHHKYWWWSSWKFSDAASNWYVNVLYLLSTSSYPPWSSPPEKRWLLLKSKPFTLIAGQLYKVSPNSILMHCISPHEVPTILEDPHCWPFCWPLPCHITGQHILQSGLWWLYLFCDTIKFAKTCHTCKHCGLLAQAISPIKQVIPHLFGMAIIWTSGHGFHWLHHPLTPAELSISWSPQTIQLSGLRSRPPRTILLRQWPSFCMRTSLAILPTSTLSPCSPYPCLLFLA